MKDIEVNDQPKAAAAVALKGSATAFPILFALSFSHMLNDTLQSLIPAIYPLLKAGFGLTFLQVGLITFTNQVTASLLQPLVGMYTDKRPHPYSLVFGMTLTLTGLILLGTAGHFSLILVAVAFVGAGSSILHPEASRIAFLASGGKHGLAQSIFQLGGNAGTSLGPLLAALVITPFGRQNVAWFALLAIPAIAAMIYAGRWYHRNRLSPAAKKKPHALLPRPGCSARRVKISIFILLTLVFSKNFYLASMTSYFTFYLKHKFDVSNQFAQLYLFLFLFAVAAGTLIGGPLGDRIGRKYVIWISLLGSAPFTLLLPYADLLWTGILAFFIGVVLASAFSAILIYAQELVPGKVGMIAGLFFGFAFGMGGLGSAVLGELADRKGIDFVYQVCSFLPLIGLITIFLPNVQFGKKPKELDPILKPEAAEEI